MFAKQVGQRLVFVGIFGEDALGAGILLINELLHLLVDDARRLVGVGLLEGFLRVVVGEVGHPFAHAEEGHHAVGALSDALQVVEGTAGDAAEHHLFGSTTCQSGTHLVEHLFAGDDGALFGQIPSRAKTLSARYDGHLHQRVGVFQKPRHRSVSGFVDGNGALFLLRHDARLLLQTADDAVDSVEEVLFRDRLAVVAGGDECGFVADVGDVGTGKSGSLTCQQFDVKTVLEFEGREMHFENGHTFRQVGQINVDLSVETSGTQQRLVEHIDAVGGGQNNHSGVGAEAVHFGEQLIEGVFAFVVATEAHAFGARTSHGVDFVDEDDGGGFLFGLLEQVTHTTRADTDKHFHKVGTRHREEGYTRLTGHGFGE